MNVRPFKIDVTTIGSHRFGSHTNVEHAREGLYTVNLDPSQIVRHSLQPFAVMAHEVGHVLGVEYGLPKHCEFLETITNIATFPVNIEEATIAREREAWDMAEAMFDIRRLREEALRSYERRLSLEEIFYKIENRRPGFVKTTD